MAILVSSGVSLFIVAVAMLQLRFVGPEPTSITVVAGERAEEIQECLQSSREARLRFEARLCHRRSMWFDGCEDARSELHTVRFDEVTESYRVVSDRLRDELEPIAVSTPVKSEAVRLVTTLEDLPLSFLDSDDRQALLRRDAYVQVRTIFVCRGRAYRTLAHVSRIITLGLINAVEERSDWTDFSVSAGSHRLNSHKHVR